MPFSGFQLSKGCSCQYHCGAGQCWKADLRNNEGKICSSFYFSHIMYSFPLLGVTAPPSLLLGKCSSLTLWSFCGTANPHPLLTPSCPQGGHDQECAYHFIHPLAKLSAQDVAIWFKVGQSPSLEFVGIQGSSSFFLGGNENVTPEWLTVILPTGCMAKIPLQCKTCHSCWEYC